MVPATPLKSSDSFIALWSQCAQLSKSFDPPAPILILPEGNVDWAWLTKLVDNVKILVASTQKDVLESAKAQGIETVLLDLPDASSVSDRMTHALLHCVSNDLIGPAARIITLFRGFNITGLDTISIVNMEDHFGRLTSRELKQLEMTVPLRTLKTVINLATEIGREGRENKRVGALFIVGDTSKVLAHSKPVGFDPVRGYHRKYRNLRDSKVREGIKEIAQLDGAFIIDNECCVRACCRLIDTPTAQVSLSMGLGTRHWAAASVSKKTKAIAVVVSQSSGTVRIFANGEVILRIESRHTDPMVWRDFESDQSIMPLQ